MQPTLERLAKQRDKNIKSLGVFSLDAEFPGAAGTIGIRVLSQPAFNLKIGFIPIVLGESSLHLANASGLLGYNHFQPHSAFYHAQMTTRLPLIPANRRVHIQFKTELAPPEYTLKALFSGKINPFLNF